MYLFSSSCCSTVLPKIIPFTFGEEPSYIGDSHIVHCGISTGDMPVKFSWFLNGKPIDNTNGVNIGSFGKKDSVLSIDNLSETHAGNYTCLAQNRAGIASYHSELVVKGITTSFNTFIFSGVPNSLTQNNPVRFRRGAVFNGRIRHGSVQHLHRRSAHQV